MSLPAETGRVWRVIQGVRVAYSAECVKHDEAVTPRNQSHPGKLQSIVPSYKTSTLCFVWQAHSYNDTEFYSFVYQHSNEGTLGHCSRL